VEQGNGRVLRTCSCKVYQNEEIEENYEDRWEEGIFLGINWRTGEHIVSTDEGVKKFGTIRRAGGQRRWDAEKIAEVKETPWKAKEERKEKDEVKAEAHVRRMTEEEKTEGVQPREEDLSRPGRVRLTKEDFFDCGVHRRLQRV